MFVRTESLSAMAQQQPTVRVHTPIGSAVGVWHGDPREAEGRHLVEWTVDEDIHWGRNAWPAAAAEARLWQAGGQVNMSGHLELLDDGAACLRMGHWLVLLDVVSPVPREREGSWVRISVGSESVALYPYKV
ncbi:hypothetical protein [Streptomyces tritici]|uniref:hypothetical protein n=1 Tax=Streptomyces tritici TaxID=2054410 RepID=UPI003AF02462